MERTCTATAAELILGDIDTRYLLEIGDPTGRLPLRLPACPDVGDHEP